MTPSLASLVADVCALTNRPDRVSETALAIRNATLKAHASDYYYKDILETGVSFNTSSMLQSLEYKTLIPLFRSVKYINKCDALGVPLGAFEILTPDNVVDSYGAFKAEVAYIAGVEMQLRSAAEFQYILLGCYVRPDVTPDNYNSWIAEEQPAAIVYEAAATVFKTIGYDEQAAAYAKMVADEYAILRMNNIVAGGY